MRELSERMESGTLTSEQLVQHLLDRIGRIDSLVNSVIAVDPTALEQARSLDRVWAETGERVGPLHGIPVLIKDNVDTGDAVPTTVGSLALEGHYAPDDAFLVTALREAGAVLLGKANLSEWANFRGHDSTSGWSSLGGQTRNPYVLDRNPCGSSSGSGAAVAAALAPLAVGTETDGSIVCPSGVNGVVGVKPTLGLVSRDGIVPISISQDTAGPMARTVADAAVLLDALDRPDSRDPAAKEHPGQRDYLTALDSRALDGVRIGVLRGYYGAGENAEVEALFEQALEALHAQGAVIVDPVEFPDDAELGIAPFDPSAVAGDAVGATDANGSGSRSGDYENSGDPELEVLLHEFRDGLDRYLATAGVPPALASMAGVVEFNRAHADRVMPWFGQELFEEALARGPLTDPRYLEAARANGQAMRTRLRAVFQSQKLDAIVAPTNGPAWPIDLVAGDRFELSSSHYAAVSGFPNVTVPMGFVHELPIGLSFVGLAWTEPELLSYAFAFEQATMARRDPTFRPTLERY